jgi:hypothetical protein
MADHSGETLLRLAPQVTSSDGIRYEARACGSPAADGSWQGWIEFTPLDGGEPVRTPRETTQPNRTDTVYWATGLTPVFLEGALGRALKRRRGATVDAVGGDRVHPAPPVVQPSIFNGPADRSVIGIRDSLIDPFSVYEHGEAHLRKQLSAFAAWHLVNIVREFDLSHADTDTLNHMPPTELVELIVNSVRARAESPHASTHPLR